MYITNIMNEFSSQQKYFFLNKWLKKNCPLFFLGWGAFSLENIRKYLKSQEDSRKSATSASNADPSMLKQENKELKDLTICKICLDEKVSIVFLPCGHLVSCPQCAPALTKCPICRKGIKGTVRTNLVEKNTLKANTLDKNNPKTNTKKT